MPKIIKDGRIYGAAPGSLSGLADISITSPINNEALVWNQSLHKWVNGTVSTVGSIDDLDDVDTTGKSEGDNLRYDGSEWVAKPTTIEMTLAEWNAIADKQAWRNAHKDTYLVITDAPNLNATAQDISYDGGADTVWDKVESLDTIVTKSITISITCRGYIRCYQLGKLVFVDININTDGNTTPVDTTIATGFPKPYESFYPRLLARDNNGSYAQVLNFDKNNGTIKTADTVMQGNTWWGCQYTYFTND